ncbi:hypothetical protein BGZ50_004487 [Haplosporangium sp. Z 11]|nr:hypothetical protein BGZ50_004487 [Haplosporangium sp. Z 11]
MTSTCILNDCSAYLNDFSTCSNGSFDVTEAMLPCFCTTSAIANYAKCYPCLITVPGQGNALSVAAYTNACNNKGTMSPYNPYLPSYSVGGPTATTGAPRPSNTGSKSEGGSSNTGLYAGIGAGVGALVLGVALFFFMRNRKKNKGPSKSDQLPSPSQHQQQPPLQQIQHQQQQQNQFVQAAHQSPPAAAQYLQQQLLQQQQQPYDYQQQHQQQQYVQQYSQAPQPPPTSTYYPNAAYADPNQQLQQQQFQQQQQQQQQQHYYPTVVPPPPVSQPNPSPTFAPADQHHQHQAAYQQQLQQQQQQQPVSTVPVVDNIATVGNQGDFASAQPALSPIPMPMQTQSHGFSAASSPAATVISSSVGQATTVYEPSPQVKPQAVPHNPQYVEQSFVSAPSSKNPQYIDPSVAYHQ